MRKIICKFYVLYNTFKYAFVQSLEQEQGGMLKKLLLLPVLLNLFQKRNKTAKKATKKTT
jgi:hypothetical protein